MKKIMNIISLWRETEKSNAREYPAGDAVPLRDAPPRTIVLDYFFTDKTSY